MRTRQRRLDPLPEPPGFFSPRHGKFYPWAEVERQARQRMALVDACPANVRKLVHEDGFDVARAYHIAKRDAQHGRKSVKLSDID